MHDLTARQAPIKKKERKKKTSFLQELHPDCRVGKQKGIVTGRMENPFSLIMSYSMVVQKKIDHPRADESGLK